MYSHDNELGDQRLENKTVKENISVFQDRIVSPRGDITPVSQAGEGRLYMQETRLPLMVVKGTPHDIGMQTGVLMKDIFLSLRDNCGSTLSVAGISDADSKKEIPGWIRRNAILSRDDQDELAGIAMGAGIDDAWLRDHMLRLSWHCSKVYGTYQLAVPSGSGVLPGTIHGCLNPSSSPDLRRIGWPFIFQYKGKIPFMGICAFPGSGGVWMGVNAFGLSASLTCHTPPVDIDGSFVPAERLVRNVLMTSESLTQAEAVLRSAYRGGGWTILLSHGNEGWVKQFSHLPEGVVEQADENKDSLIVGPRSLITGKTADTGQDDVLNTITEKLSDSGYVSDLDERSRVMHILKDASSGTGFSITADTHERSLSICCPSDQDAAAPLTLSFSGEWIADIQKEAGKTSFTGTGTGVSAYPMITRIRRMVPTIEIERDLTLAEDRYLLEHTVDNDPVLPGSFGVDMMGEIASLATGRQVTGIHDVGIHRFIKVLSGSGTRIKASATILSETNEMEIRLMTDFFHPDGRLLQENRLHYSGRVGLDSSQSAKPRVTREMLDTAHKGGVLMDSFYQLSRNLTVRVGPMFNCMRWLKILPNRMAIACLQFLPESRLFASTNCPTTVFPPLFLDGMFQVPAVLASYLEGFIAVPDGVKSLSWYRQPAIGERCFAFTVLGHPHNSVVPANVVVTDQAGDVIAGLEGFTVRLAFPMEPYVVDEFRNIFTPGKTPVIENRTGIRMTRIRHTKRNGVAAPASATPLSHSQKSDHKSAEVRNTTLEETRTPPEPFKQQRSACSGTKITRPDTMVSRRFKMEITPVSLKGKGMFPFSFKKRSLLIIADAVDIYKEVAVQLESKGTQTVILFPREYAPADAEWVFDPDQPETLTDALNTIRTKHKSLNGFINLMGLEPSGSLSEIPGNIFEQALSRHCLVLFHLCRFFFKTFKMSPPGGSCCVIATSTGPVYGDNPVHNPYLSGLNGFVKSLRVEAPILLTKAIDFETIDPPSSVAELILAEISSGDMRTQVYYRQGQRYGIKTTEICDPDISSEDLVFDTASVVLFTGGGRGVTFECARTLARTSGCRVVVCGRTAPPGEDNPWLRMSDQELLGHRPAFLSEYRKNHPGCLPKDALKAFERLSYDRELVNNIENARQEGLKCHYDTCDVMDRQQVFDWLESVRARFGRIDGVVHGAMVEQSKSIDLKSQDTAWKSIAVKAMGFLHLREGVRNDNIRRFVNFSSLAGVFGNKGQEDYSTANAVLSGTTAACDEPGRYLTVDWPGWLGAGGVERYDGSLKEAIKKKIQTLDGTFVTIEEGTYRFLQLLRKDETEKEVAVCGESMMAISPLGIMSDGLGLHRRYTDDTGKPLLACLFPLVDHVGPGTSENGCQVFMKNPDNMDHAVCRSPGGMAGLGLEILAQASAVALPRVDISSVREFVFERPFDPSGISDLKTIVRYEKSTRGTGVIHAMCATTPDTPDMDIVHCRAVFTTEAPGMFPAKPSTDAPIPEGEVCGIAQGIPDTGFWQFCLPVMLPVMQMVASAQKAGANHMCRIQGLIKGYSVPSGAGFIPVNEKGKGLVCYSEKGAHLFTLPSAVWSVREDVPESQEDRSKKNLKPSASAVSTDDDQVSEAPLDIAIVGMSCYFAGIPDLDTYLSYIRNGGCTIGEVPEERWSWDAYGGPEALGPEKIDVRIGSFVPNDVPLSWRDFRIVPKDLPLINSADRMMLEETRKALMDAGITPGHEDCLKTAVIVGAGTVGTEKWGAVMRNRVDEVVRAFRSSETYQNLTPKKQERLAKGLMMDLLQKVGNLEESGAPDGALSVSLSRLTSLFDIKGPRFVVDGGCASGLAAVDIAIQGIQLGEFRRAVAVGVSPMITPHALAAFGSLGFEDGPCFLSKRGIHPFDQQSDGTVLGEGAGAVVLRPLADALKDGDRIYAVIKGCVGRSSGARGDLFSFNTTGLSDTVRLALKQAGAAPETVDFVECHGNGVPASDQGELEAISQVYTPAMSTADRTLALGSVKSQIGYLMSGAGIAGMIKTALCLHHGFIPGQHGFHSPHPSLKLDDRAFRIPTEEQPLETGNGRPPRAGVTAIGLGGIFYHMIMEGACDGNRTSIPPTGTKVLVNQTPPRREPVAIIGMAGIFPGADNVTELWSNTMKKDCRVQVVPKDRLDPDVHVDHSRKRPWRSYTDLGTVLEQFPLPEVTKGLWPRRIDAMNPTQWLTMHCVAEALKDAGVRPGTWNPQRVALSVGEINDRMREVQSRMRVSIGGMLHYLSTSFAFKTMPEKERTRCLKEISRILGDQYPQIDADLVFGYLSCINTGRIAHKFDIQGFHLTTETVCSSSVTAINVCLQALQLRRCDVALAGGVWANLTPEFYAQLCYLNAVSTKGLFPFDERADGVVPGEGGGMLVLKRLSDAEKDGDRIHAVIRGIGSSSDGRLKTILAPNPEAQILAMQRAFQYSDVDPETIDFVECHGASTKGDVVEVESLRRGYGRESGHPLYLGSVKANIGHLNSAAGVAGVIKAVMALQHKVIPPLAGYEISHPQNEWGSLKVPTEAVPWETSNGHPRRAGVNSLGMMGHNYHMILEEHPA